MLKLIREVLKVGEATLPYPFAPLEQMPGFAASPIMTRNAMACGASALACPPNALSMATDLD